jgi:hypothetical protein
LENAYFSTFDLFFNRIILKPTTKQKVFVISFALKQNILKEDKIMTKKELSVLEQINATLAQVATSVASLETRVSKLEAGKVSKAQTSTKSDKGSKKTTAKTSKKSTAPTKAQLEARKAWGEAQHARAEARKALFNIVETPEYQAEWKKWTNSKAYKNASTRAERKELNKKKHAEIVAKLSK